MHFLEFGFVSSFFHFRRGGQRTRLKIAPGDEK